MTVHPLHVSRSHLDHMRVRIRSKALDFDSRRNNRGMPFRVELASFAILVLIAFTFKLLSAWFT